MINVSPNHHAKARIKLFERIIKEFERCIGTINENSEERNRITVTSQLTLKQFFDVYRQPDGAPNAKKIHVSWDGTSVKVEGPDRFFSELFETQESNGVLELKHITIGGFVSLILTNVP